MLWFVILGAFAVGLVIALSRAAPRQPAGLPPGADCLRCDGPARTLRAEAHSAYEILACPACKLGWPLVHHVPNRIAYCPACQNRAMDTRCVAVLPEADGLRVDVEERCHLCGHEAERMLSAPHPRPMGKVLRFERRR